MKIIHFTSSYPLNSNDAGGVFIQELVKFISREHKVFVLTPDGPESKNLEVYDNYEVHRFQYFIKKYQGLVCNDSIIQNLKKNPLNVILLIFMIIRAGQSLYKLTKKEKIDIVHCHWVIPQGTIAVLLKKFLGLKIKIVITTHGSDVENKKGSLLAPFIKYTLKNCDVINAVSTHLADEIRMLDPTLNNIKIIPMGTCRELFDNTSSHAKAIGKHKPYILFVGRLSEHKAIDILINAFFIVQKNHPSLELWIVGSGNQEKTLKSLTSNLWMKNKVRFHGNVEHQQLPDYYKNAEMFVSASTEEGFGLVFVEALLSKCPVIALDVGGVRDIIINGKTGILISPNDMMTKLVEAINAILTDKDLRTNLIRSGFTHASKNFSWDIIVERFSQLYLSIVEN